MRILKSSNKLADKVSAKIEKECPEVKWKQSYGVLGRYDIVDIVESVNTKQLTRAIMILRTSGHETTETMMATPWKEYLSGF